MKTHELKTDPQIFRDTWCGDMMFEVRLDDRGYQIGDRVILKETEFTGVEMLHGQPLVYTGRHIELTIRFILRGPIYGLVSHWIIFGFDSFIGRTE